MSMLPKSNNKTSSRRQINIRGVRDGILMLPDNQYRVIMEVSSLNFELKSEDEQDTLIDTYQSLINSLPCPIQVLVRIRELDMSHYMENLVARKKNEREPVYQDQLQAYSEFVQALVADNKILSRHFYIVLPYSASGKDAYEEASEQLALNSDLVRKGFMRLGMQTRLLESLEVLDLFHSFYNPAQAKHHPVSERITQLINSSFTHGVRS
jgi:hypothetical protein